MFIYLKINCNIYLILIYIIFFKEFIVLMFFFFFRGVFYNNFKLLVDKEKVFDIFLYVLDYIMNG